MAHLQICSLRKQFHSRIPSDWTTTFTHQRRKVPWLLFLFIRIDEKWYQTANECRDAINSWSSYENQNGSATLHLSRLVRKIFQIIVFLGLRSFPFVELANLLIFQSRFPRSQVLSLFQVLRIACFRPFWIIPHRWDRDFLIPRIPASTLSLRQSATLLVDALKKITAAIELRPVHARRRRLAETQTSNKRRFLTAGVTSTTRTIKRTERQIP